MAKKEEKKKAAPKKKPPKKKKLTQVEMMICMAKLENPTWSKARCYRVGHPKCKKSSSYSSAVVFFNKKHIAEYMDKNLKKIEEKSRLSIEYVLLELQKRVEFNPQCFLDKDGNMLPLKDLDPEDAKLIESVGKFAYVKTVENGEAKVTPYIAKYKTGKALDALKMIGAYFGMWKDDDEPPPTDNPIDRRFEVVIIEEDPKKDKK